MATLPTAGERHRLSQLITSISRYSTAENPTRGAELRDKLLRRLRDVLEIVEAHDRAADRQSYGYATDAEPEEYSDDGPKAPPHWQSWADMMPGDRQGCFACHSTATSYVYAVGKDKGPDIPTEWEDIFLTADEGIEYVSLCEHCKPDWDHLELDEMTTGVDAEKVGVAVRDVNGDLLPATGFMTDMMWHDSNTPNRQNQRSDDGEAGESY